MHVNEDYPMTLEEIATDYDLPLDAVLEVIAYCDSNPLELAEDCAREEALRDATGMNELHYDGRTRVLTPEEMARPRRRRSST
jgi:hypothetical protein